MNRTVPFRSLTTFSPRHVRLRRAPLSSAYRGSYRRLHLSSHRFVCGGTGMKMRVPIDPKLAVAGRLRQVLRIRYDKRSSAPNSTATLRSAGPAGPFAA
jgi:hypothetical protein